MVHQLDLVRAEPIELLPQSVCSGKRGAAASDDGQRQIQSESLPKKREIEGKKEDRKRRLLLGKSTRQPSRQNRSAAQSPGFLLISVHHFMTCTVSSASHSSQRPAVAMMDAKYQIRLFAGQ